jgi:hypothetical protein
MRRHLGRELVGEIRIFLTEFIEILHEFVDGIFHVHMPYTRPYIVLLIDRSVLLLQPIRTMKLVPLVRRFLKQADTCKLSRLRWGGGPWPLPDR